MKVCPFRKGQRRAAYAFLPKLQVVLQVSNVVLSPQLSRSQRRFWHGCHIWVLSSRGVSVPKLIEESARQVPWVTLCDSNRSTKHFLEPWALPVARHTPILLLEASLEDACAAYIKSELFAEGTQKIDLTAHVDGDAAVSDGLDETVNVCHTCTSNVPVFNTVLVLRAVAAVFVLSFEGGLSRYITGKNLWCILEAVVAVTRRQ